MLGSMIRWPYKQGYTGRNYHVTGGHEKEAEAAERAKKPTRVGLLVLRLLGFKGGVPKPAPPVRRGSPSHEHRHKAP